MGYSGLSYLSAISFLSCSSGWIQDGSGKWVKDENVEFDSDEEEPPMLPPALMADGKPPTDRALEACEGHPEIRNEMAQLSENA